MHASLRAQALASMGGRAKHGSRAVEAIPVGESEPAKAPAKLSKPPPAGLSAGRPESRREHSPERPPRAARPHAPPSSSYPFRQQESAVNQVIANQRATLRARMNADAHIWAGLRTWACDQIMLHKAPVPRIQTYK